MARRKGEIVRARDEELYVRQNITGADAGHQRLENEVAKNSIDEECRRQHAADPPRPAEDQQHRRQCGPDEAGVSQMGEKSIPASKIWVRSPCKTVRSISSTFIKRSLSRFVVYRIPEVYE